MLADKSIHGAKKGSPPPVWLPEVTHEIISAMRCETSQFPDVLEQNFNANPGQTEAVLARLLPATLASSQAVLKILHKFDQLLETKGFTLKEVAPDLIGTPNIIL